MISDGLSNWAQRNRGRYVFSEIAEEGPEGVVVVTGLRSLPS